MLGAYGVLYLGAAPAGAHFLGHSGWFVLRIGSGRLFGGLLYRFIEILTFFEILKSIYRYIDIYIYIERERDGPRGVIWNLVVRASFFHHTFEIP